MSVPHDVLALCRTRTGGTHQVGAVWALRASELACAEVPGEIREASERRQEATARGDLMEMIQAGAFGFMRVLHEIVDMSYRLRSEVCITDDSLADGAEDVLNTQLHEPAHLLANVRGIRDTSSRGRYHNGRFREVARELGLEACSETGTAAGRRWR
jgi:hypothetical protein